MTRVLLPGSETELWETLRREGGATLFAGGTDLFVALHAGKRRPGVLVGLERVPELRTIEESGEGLRIGAAVPLARILAHPAVRRDFSVLASAVAVLGSPQVRHMGTLGGNVVSASPAADTLPPLAVLEAEAEVASEGARRRVPIARFVLGPGRVDLAQGELLAAVHVPRPRGFSLQHHEKVGRRRALACAVASLAALLDVDETGIVRRARLAWGSVGPTVVRSREAEEALTGTRLDAVALARLAPLVEQAVQPIDDVRASASYRRRVAGALLVRLAAARGGAG